MAKRRLGELLREDGLVDELQLRAALGFHNKWGVPLGQVVVDMGFCTAQQVLETLARQLRLPTVDLDAEVLAPRLADALPARVAEACRAVPLRYEGPRDSVLVVATTAPAHPPALDEVARVSGKARVVTLLATDAAISSRRVSNDSKETRCRIESFDTFPADTFPAKTRKGSHGIHGSVLVIVAGWPHPAAGGSNDVEQEPRRRGAQHDGARDEDVQCREVTGADPDREGARPLLPASLPLARRGPAPALR